MSMEKEKPRYLTYDDLEWTRKRIDKLERNMRLLIRLLVEKKIIGEELAKSFMETVDKNEVVEWYLKKDKE